MIWGQQGGKKGRDKGRYGGAMPVAQHAQQGTRQMRMLRGLMTHLMDTMCGSLLAAVANLMITCSQITIGQCAYVSGLFVQ